VTSGFHFGTLEQKHVACPSANWIGSASPFPSRTASQKKARHEAGSVVSTSLARHDASPTSSGAREVVCKMAACRRWRWLAGPGSGANGARRPMRTGHVAAKVTRTGRRPVATSRIPDLPQLVSRPNDLTGEALRFLTHVVDIRFALKRSWAGCFLSWNAGTTVSLQSPPRWASQIRAQDAQAGFHSGLGSTAACASRGAGAEVGDGGTSMTERFGHAEGVCDGRPAVGVGPGTTRGDPRLARSSVYYQRGEPSGGATLPTRISSY
jgi:hypothetical protein